MKNLVQVVLVTMLATSASAGLSSTDGVFNCRLAESYSFDGLPEVTELIRPSENAVIEYSFDGANTFNYTILVGESAIGSIQSHINFPNCAQGAYFEWGDIRYHRAFAFGLEQISAASNNSMLSQKGIDWCVVWFFVRGRIYDAAMGDFLDVDTFVCREEVEGAASQVLSMLCE